MTTAVATSPHRGRRLLAALAVVGLLGGTAACSTGSDAKSADTWRAELDKNRDGTLALLETLPKNKAVPVDEIGHGVSREDSALDAENATVFAQITGKTYGKDA